MNTSNVCSACRWQILNRTRHIQPRQWRAASSFVSLSSIGDVEAPKAKPRHIENKKHVDKSQRRPALARKPGDFLESLFVESLQPEEATSTQNQKEAFSSTLETYEAIETLKNMVASTTAPIHHAWDFLVCKFGHKALPQATSRTLPHSFKAVAGSLLKRIREEKQEGSTGHGLPTATKICQLYFYLHVLKLETWNTLADDLLERIASSIPNSSPRSEDIDVEAVSQDLIGMWRYHGGTIHHGSHLRAFGKPNPRDWDFVLPSAIDGSFANTRLLLKEEHLQSHTGIQREKRLKENSIALVTFAVLSNYSAVTVGDRYQDHYFVKRLKRHLSMQSFHLSDLSNSYPNIFWPVGAETLKKLNIDWSQVTKSLNSHENIPHKQKALHPAVKRVLQGANFSRPMLNQTSRILTEALKSRDLDKIDHLWHQASSMPPKGLQEQNEKPLSPDLCDQFILTYLSLRQSNRAIDVWNHMLNSSIQPTLKTWNAMLEGCRLSRSPAAVEGVWAKMMASGTKPDMVCWTTRISVLADCGKTDKAIQALEEMGTTWIRAARSQKVKDLKSSGDVNGVIKPTTAVINAAIVGLIRHQQGDAAHRVLAWGDILGIKPDLITFNTLLQPLVRDGRTEAVQAILSHMQSQGIQADVATFTTIFDELFRNSSSQTPSEQTKIINNIFTEMVAASVTPNMHTYGKVLHTLVENPATIADSSAVQAVLEHMAAQGLEPSTYVYTILIRYHFSKSPPDLEAVRSLLDRIQLSKTFTDLVFWDRVIEGFARAGDTAAALKILGREDREGSRVGWRTMQEVLVALARNGEEDMAHQFVKNVRTDRGGPPGANDKGIDGQHNFWRAAAEFGLA